MKIAFKIVLKVLAVFIVILAIIVILSAAADLKGSSNEPPVTVMVGGDVMLDRHIRALGERNHYAFFFRDIGRLFRQADIGVINLEGPVTGNPSKTLLPDGRTTDSFVFTFDPKAVEPLRTAGIDLVSLANNHTDNFDRAGVDETHAHIDRAGVGWFGDPANIPGTEAVKCVSSGEFRAEPFCVAFVGYHEFQPGIDRIAEDVRRLSTEYPVVVYAHWGEEYEPIAMDRVRAKAREFVTAGASAVIGGHPHVIQDMEWVGGVPVIYSLGNLVFDQYFSKEVMEGYVAEIRFIRKNEKTMPADRREIKKNVVDRVFIHKVSNEARRGPRVVGEAVEFIR